MRYTDAKCGRHSHYADGNPRPLFRGWLHGFLAVITLPATAYGLLGSTAYINAVMAPMVISVCWLLTFSSALHLNPWRSIAVEDYVCRLDRLGVVLITACCFYSPHILTCDASCRPPMSFTVWLVLLPNSVSAGMVLYGAKLGDRPSPLSFSGVLVSCVTMGMFWIYSKDYGLLAYELAVVSLDAIGMHVYALQMGGDQPKWGFHEWMHLSVGIGFYINIYMVYVISQRCEV